MYASITDKRWIDWTDDFMNKTRKVIMEQKVAENMLMCLIPEERPDLLENFTRGVEQDGAQLVEFRMWEAHAKRLSLDCTATVKAFFVAGGLCSSVGVMVMYIHAVRRLQMIHGRKVSMRDLTMGPFANGFPPESELHRMWDEQKRSKEDGLTSATFSHDNYLDCVVDMPSEDNRRPAGAQ